jgi:geranylgeranyl reductase family protein
VRAADVVVVGAGPAGSAAATVLARAGRDVVVVDKATFPRDKCCGDGLTAAALRLLEQLGLEPASVPSWTPVGTVVLHGPDHRRVSLPLPAEGLYSVVARRVELDAALLALAAAAGAEVRQGTACTDARAARDRVVVSLADGSELHARYLVAADGMWSPLRKQLGAAHPGGYRGEWHAFRQYLRDVGPDAVDAQHVWFEPDLLPGYAWSFPVGGGTVNVGFGVQRGAGPPVGDMGRRWAELLRRPAVAAVLGPSAVAEGPHRAWPIPARVDRAVLTAAGGRALFVGDAAAATDPLTGEGIG